jgi:hypothetical protein
MLLNKAAEGEVAGDGRMGRLLDRLRQAGFPAMGLATLIDQTLGKAPDMRRGAAPKWGRPADRAPGVPSREDRPHG